MSDFKITAAGNGYDLVQVDGDLVLETDEVNLVVQRVIYRVMTWLKESPYDRTAGIPYMDGIFGFEGPVEAIVFVLAQEVLDTDGVDAIIGQPEYTLSAERSLSLSIKILVSGDVVPVQLEISQ